MDMELQTFPDTGLEALLHRLGWRASLDLAEVAIHDELAPIDCPVEHSFADGMYIRKTFLPAGTVLTTKTHNTTHPFFVMEGDFYVGTEDGEQRITAPYHGFTYPGTLRFMVILKDTIFITVQPNPDNLRDIEEIEKQVMLPRKNSIKPLRHADANGVQHREAITN